MASKKDQGDFTAELEKAADAIVGAEFLIVVAGPAFDDVKPFTDSDYCDPSAVANPNKFMGFWGDLFNEFNERTPHEGYNIITRWRDKMFCQEDVRKRQGKKRPEDENELDHIQRCFVFTRSIGNLFQKCGFPNEEVYEVAGNITLWQCSRVPPCCSKLTNVDRNFRFVIDETNQEAQPIKYVPDKREQPEKEAYIFHEMDDDDVAAMQLNAYESKLSREECQKRAQRRLTRSRAIFLTEGLQIGMSRFQDYFSGFSTNAAQGVAQFTFANAITNGIPEAPPIVSRDKDRDRGPQRSRPEVKYLPPKRLSHLLAHVNVLDRHMYQDRIGLFYEADPEKWQRDREAYYQHEAKMFVSESAAVAQQRARYISYNISVIFTLPQQQRIGAASGDDGDGYRSHVVHPSRLSPLLAVYPGEDRIGQRSLVDAAIAGTPSAQEECAERFRGEVEQWEQGKWGWFYFSHVRGQTTCQEPIERKYHDVVRIDFPLNSNGDPVTTIPLESRVSIVCETVVYSDPADAKSRNLRDEQTQVTANAYSYTSNVWQLVGDLHTPTFSDPVFKKARAKEFGGAEEKQDLAELILESTMRHIVKIGVNRSNRSGVQYLEIEVPCDETNPLVSSDVIQRVTCAEDKSRLQGKMSEGFSSLMESLKRSDDRLRDAKPPIPTANHLTCAYCHDYARPYVLMTRPGIKDDGFCAGYLAARTKAFKAWEKQMLEAMKSDSNKSMVLLEVGSEKKLDPCRSYAEKTFKQHKNSRCTMVRLCPVNIEGKKGAGQAPPPNYASIQMPVIAGLAALDKAVSEKLKRAQRAP